MSLVSFGQPDDGVIQMAYVVEDIQRSMLEFAKKLKIGPWFLLEHFTGEDAQYRGQPTNVDVSIAMGFAGHMMFELIQQRNDAPSVYRDTIAKQGYGFHHWGIATWNFDADVERYRASGYELAFFARGERRTRRLHGHDCGSSRHGGTDRIRRGFRADVQPVLPGLHWLGRKRSDSAVLR